MVKKILVIISFIFSLNLNAQIPKLKDIQHIKESKIIVGLTSNSELNTALKEVVSSIWNLSEIKSFLPLKSALSKASKDESLFVLYLGSTETESFKFGPKGYPVEYRYISKGKFLGFSKGGKRPLMKSFIPSYDNIIPKESIAQGVKFVQEVFKTMIENNLKNGLKAISEFENNGKDLKNKTLYIPEGWVDSKLTEEQIEKYYGSKFEIVSYQKWKEAILTKKAGIAYVILIPIPVGGQYLYQHQICDAETDTFYAVIQPKAGVSLNGVNMSKSNTGLINKKNIKNYNKVLAD